MALLSVAEALERVLAHAAPLPAEEVPLAEADGRVLADRSQGAAHAAAGRRLGHGRLRGARRRCRERAGAAESHRRGRRRPAVRGTRRRRRSGAHFHRRRGAGRRRHRRDPGTHQARRRLRRSRKSRRARAATSAAQGLDFAAGDVLLARGPSADRARPCARRRHEPSARARAPAAEGRAVRDRRRTGAARHASPARARSSPPTALRSPRWRAPRAPTSIDLGIVGDRLDDTIAAVRARARAAAPTFWSPRGGASVGDYDLVQKALCRRRHGAVVLEAGDAARPAADARPARRHAGARRARQSGLGLSSALFCSWCR